MKMNYLLFGLMVLVAVAPQAGFAQCWWSYVSGDIYNVNSGNVGIGTADPDVRLHVVGTEANPVIVQGNAGTYSGLDLKNTHPNGEGATNSWTVLMGTRATSGYAGLQPGNFAIRQHLAEDDLYRFIIDDSGNVGIGTTSPDSSLEVQGATEQTIPIVHIKEGDGQISDVFLRIDTLEEDPLFVVNGGGDVGIGTDEPDGALHVEGDDIIIGNASYEAQGRLFFMEHYDGEWGVSLVYNGDSTTWHSVPENCFGIVRHQDDSTGEAAVIVDRYSGNVGVGVTSPARTLHVKDVLRLEPQSSAPSGGKGDLYAGTDGKLYFHNGTAWQEVAFQ